MKTLNFSSIEILPSLLNKTKVQTIRKAWKDGIKSPFFEDKYPPKKEPKFSVGDKVKLYWKQRSKNKYFRKDTGEAVPINQFKEGMNQLLDDNLFNKLLGEVEITEVFPIKIHKYQVADDDKPLRDKFAVECYNLKYSYMLFNGKDLAKRDGFKSEKEFFAYFDKNYDLSSPKTFYVYRWKWK